jgi:hypothetical protein
MEAYYALMISVKVSESLSLFLYLHTYIWANVLKQTRLVRTLARKRSIDDAEQRKKCLHTCEEMRQSC